MRAALFLSLALVSTPALANDCFANSRWSVETELGLPISVELGASDSSFRATALQVRAKLSCEVRSEKKSKSEVACEIQDIGVHGATPGGAKMVAIEATLSEIDAELTGATVVFTSTPQRPIQEPHLEGGGKGLHAETLDYIAERLVAGFDFGKPADEDTWKERGSRLMDLPARVKAGGRSKVEHTVVARDDAIEVATRGDGTFDIAPHLFFTDPLATESKRAGLNEKAEAGERGTPDSGEGLALRVVTDELKLEPKLGVQGGLRDAAALPTDDIPPHAIFETEMVAQSIFSADGVLKARVWALSAKPTSSSVTSAQGWTAGRVERLAHDAAFFVGDTSPTAPPGTIGRAHLQSWVPLDEGAGI